VQDSSTYCIILMLVGIGPVRQEMMMYEFEVGDRVKVLSSDGWELGVVYTRCPQWYWSTCQYTVEFDRLGLHDFPVDSGLKAAE